MFRLLLMVWLRATARRLEQASRHASDQQPDHAYVAAQSGSPEQQTSLGVMYVEGRGVRCN